MAQPAPVSGLFRDQDGFLHSPEDAAAYTIIASGGQGFTTPAREARRMLASGHPRYVDTARTWLIQHNLPEAGESEPPDWQNWFSTWMSQHPEAMAMMYPAQPPEQEQPAASLHAVPDLPPQPPKKVTVEVVPGSRLESLLAQRETAKAALDAAEEQMRAIKDGVTAELTARYPGTGAFDIPAAPGREPLILRHSAPNRFDTRRFKYEHPDVYSNYLTPSPRWTLGVPQKRGDQ
jgi:hypothetical protein